MRLTSLGVSICIAAHATSRICESPTNMTPANFSRISARLASCSPAVPRSVHETLAVRTSSLARVTWWAKPALEEAYTLGSAALCAGMSGRPSKRTQPSSASAPSSASMATGASEQRRQAALHAARTIE